MAARDPLSPSGAIDAMIRRLRSINERADRMKRAMSDTSALASESRKKGFVVKIVIHDKNGHEKRTITLDDVEPSNVFPTSERREIMNKIVEYAHDYSLREMMAQHDEIVRKIGQILGKEPSDED